MTIMRQTTGPVPVILLFFANEQEGRRYLRNLPEELRGLHQVLDWAEHRGRFEARSFSNATLDEVLAALRDDRDHIAIVHYGGHAGPDQILLESADGPARAAHAR